MWDDTPIRRAPCRASTSTTSWSCSSSAAHAGKPLAATAIDRAIVERPYQTRAIRRVAEAFEKDKRAQGAARHGDRRRQDAHGDRARRSADARNWVKRVLFLADRVALVKQAVNAFKKHLPDAAPVNLVDRARAAEGRVYVSTYPTMMDLIDEQARRAAPLRRRPFRSRRHRRGAPLGLPQVRRDLRLFRQLCWSA